MNEGMKLGISVSKHPRYYVTLDKCVLCVCVSMVVKYQLVDSKIAMTKTINEDFRLYDRTLKLVTPNLANKVFCFFLKTTFVQPVAFSYF